MKKNIPNGYVQGMEVEDARRVPKCSGARRARSCTSMILKGLACGKPDKIIAYWYSLRV